MVNVIPETGKMWMAPVSQSFLIFAKQAKSNNMLKDFRDVSKKNEVLLKSFMKFLSTGLNEHPKIRQRFFSLERKEKQF